MSDNKSIMVQWGNHMSNKISSSLKRRIEKVLNLNEVCEVCRCYKFSDKQFYNVVAKRCYDMRSKIIRFCRRQQKQY